MLPALLRVSIWILPLLDSPESDNAQARKRAGTWYQGTALPSFPWSLERSTKQTQRVLVSIEAGGEPVAILQLNQFVLNRTPPANVPWNKFLVGSRHWRQGNVSSSKYATPLRGTNFEEQVDVFCI